MRSESLSFLHRLLDTPSPSGFEAPGQKLWLEYVKPSAARTWSDSYGNCFAEIVPAGAKRIVAVCGHADEIGLMVNHIDAQGFVYCKAIGGIDAGSIVGKRIQFLSTVAGVKNPVIGLVGATAIHLQDKEAGAKVRKLHELFIDIGAKDQASAMARLNIGDAGVFLDSSMMMTEELIVARALDNRIGTFVAAETLRLIHEQKDQLKVRVVAVSTVQEEVGLHGASMIAESVRPDIALVTDVGHATDSPGISHAQHGLFKMGEGPFAHLEESVLRMRNSRAISCVSYISHQRNVWSNALCDHRCSVQSNFLLHSAHRDDTNFQLILLFVDQAQCLCCDKCSDSIIQRACNDQFFGHHHARI